LILLELLDLVGAEDALRHRLGVAPIETLFLRCDNERAVDAHHRVAADLHMQVGRATGDGGLEKLIYVHWGTRERPNISRLRAGGARRADRLGPRFAGVDELEPAMPILGAAADDVEERFLD